MISVAMRFSLGLRVVLPENTMPIAGRSAPAGRPLCYGARHPSGSGRWSGRASFSRNNEPACMAFDGKAESAVGQVNPAAGPYPLRLTSAASGLFGSLPTRPDWRAGNERRRTKCPNQHTNSATDACKSLSGEITSDRGQTYYTVNPHRTTRQGDDTWKETDSPQCRRPAADGRTAPRSLRMDQDAETGRRQRGRKQADNVTAK